MEPITEAPVMASHAAMCRSTPAAADRQYPTAGDVLRAGIRRTATRNEIVAAQSAWDSEGGTTESSERPTGTPRLSP
jgi:hypothetical protein